MIVIYGRALLRSVVATRSFAKQPVPLRHLQLRSAAVPETRALTVRRMTTGAGAEKQSAGGGGGEKKKEAKKGWWSSAEFWGGLGAIAGWGMTGAAINDAYFAGPEIISANMTGVMLVYSSLFARWAWIVQPRNTLLCACHVSNVIAQCNQARRLIEYKQANGEHAEVRQYLEKGAMVAVVGAIAVVGSGTMQAAIVGMNAGPLSAIAAADAGPFTVHFWAPMSKWLISGASFLDLNRPTDKISIAQYTALTATGAFFSRYALLVNPINYVLCSVNIALFGSSSWHLGRKIKADYIDKK
mmetsp:Transcript_19460/g.46196  ORF Transcript_19460/g.46196 Transcript_19460/m.46196 type:complete len:299 (+) Transcript_19460:34-930(+)